MWRFPHTRMAVKNKTYLLLPSMVEVWMREIRALYRGKDHFHGNLQRPPNRDRHSDRHHNDNENQDAWTPLKLLGNEMPSWKMRAPQVGCDDISTTVAE